MADSFPTTAPRESGDARDARAQPPEGPVPLQREAPARTAGGLPAVVSSIRHAFGQAGAIRGTRLLLALNQFDGFDCPGCAWPEPDGHRSTFEFCENGAKAVAEEGTAARIDPDFFARHSVAELSRQSDHWLGKQGRLTVPMALRSEATHYEPISWDEAFALVARELNALASPDEAVFYTSGRTSNEAAFLYQLFVREFGTNNLPDCSNLCHESSGSGLGETIGVGKGNVRLDDFDHDHLCLVEIVEPDGAFPDPDRLAQAAAARLVAQVGAVRQVVGPEFADEELVKKSRLVAGPPAGVEDGLVGAGERVQLARHQREGLVPGERLVVRRAGTERHRGGEPALLPQPVIALPGELGHAVPREEVGVDAGGRALFRDCLGAVFAELERAAVAVRLWPGAAGTVEPVELVQRQEQPGAADRPGLAECVADGGDHRREAACGARRSFALQRDGPFRWLRASVAGIARLARRGGGKAVGHRRDANTSGAAQAGRLRWRFGVGRLVQLEPEQGAAPRSGAPAERSAVRLHQPLDGCETEPDAGRRGVGAPDVRFEDPRAQRIRDPRPGVLDLEDQAPAALPDP